MGEYGKFISEKRRSVPTPNSIVNKDGVCEFGTFDKEFVHLNLVDAKKPTRLPQCFNKKKLTLWEATEIHFDNGVLLCVVCDMGVFGLNLNVFYDKRTQKAYKWQTNLPSKKTVIAPNLVGGSVAEAKHKNGFIRYVNNLDEGKCALCGVHKNKEGQTLQYDLNLTRVSKPSVVSIPFGKNRPLYSQKDFFKAEGKITFNGEDFLCTENSTAVIDDHRGYYPRKMHFDWVTTLGRTLNGEQKYFAFNLTRNQSISQEDYNENLIWLEGKTSLLPPVVFERDNPTKKFKKDDTWRVKDAHDMVNLTFTVKDIFKMEVHALVVKIEYYITFGELSGYLRDEDGNKISLDGLMGMGEDKTMLF